MLCGMDKTIRYRIIVPLENRTASSLYKGLDKILRLYNKAKFFIKMIRCDREFETLMSDVMDNLNIEMEYAAPGEHVLEAERNNQVVGERIRAPYHGLPFKVIPRLMLQYLAMEAADKLNYFPAKGGVSSHYSPHMIIKKQNINFKKECFLPLGTYVKANKEHMIKNNNKSGTVDVIYLKGLPQSGHVLMNIKTGKEIIRP